MARPNGQSTPCQHRPPKYGKATGTASWRRSIRLSVQERAFEAWTRSEEFRAAHKDAGQNKPLYIDHPQFEGFEVRQTVRRGEVAVA
jgi:hypothetical protein